MTPVGAVPAPRPILRRLVSPPFPPPRDNKVLWGSLVTRVVPDGPGPSIVDLPAAGGRLTLRWSGRLDSLDLRSRPRPAGGQR